jgi:hypothetical protein
MQRYSILLCGLVLAIGNLVAHGEDADLASQKAISEMRRQQFQEKFRTRVETIKGAQPQALHAALSEDLAGDIPLRQVVSNLAYRLSPGMIRDIVETELGPTGEGNLPLELRVEYFRRMYAMGELAKTNPAGALEWLLTRKDRDTPTILDAVVSFAATENGALIAATKNRDKEWKQLVTANNPLSRLVAITYASQWAAPEDVSPILTRALEDEYWYVRFKALDFADKRASSAMSDLLERFVKRKARQGISEADQNKEETLSKMASAIVEKVAQSPTP